MRTDALRLRPVLHQEQRRRWPRFPQCPRRSQHDGDRQKVRRDAGFYARHLPCSTWAGRPCRYLKRICYEGLYDVNPVTDELKERLIMSCPYRAHGLYGLLPDRGLHRFARQHASWWVRRGSARAASRRTRCTSPTWTHQYSLLFERFEPRAHQHAGYRYRLLHERRQEVIDYVVKKYGEDKVAQIITFGTLGAKQAIRDVARALKVPLADADRIAKMVPFSLKMTIQRAMEENPRLKEEYLPIPRQKAAGHRDEAGGISRHASTHAAGVVISRPHHRACAAADKPRDGSVITQFPMNTLEAWAFEDGLPRPAQLTVIRHTIELVEARAASRSRWSSNTTPQGVRADRLGRYRRHIPAGKRGYAAAGHAAQGGEPRRHHGGHRAVPAVRWKAYPHTAAKRNPKSVKYLHPRLKPILRRRTAAWSTRSR